MVVLTSLSRESRDDVLPAKFPCGFGLFMGVGAREADFAKAFFEVGLVDEADGLEMQFEVRDERVGVPDSLGIMLPFLVITILNLLLTIILLRNVRQTG